MSIEDTADLVAENLLGQRFVEVLAHHDADGIAAASIIGMALWRAGKQFRLRIRPQISSADVTGENAVLLCDFGSAEELLPEETIVIDHHVPHFEGQFHLNPRLEGISGDRELSAAGAAYLVAERMGDNRDLSGLVLLGILGDGQRTEGANHEIVSEGIAQGYIGPNRGLCLPGRDLTEQLAYSISPYLEGISGNRDAAAELVKKSTRAAGPDLDILLSLIVLQVSQPATLHAMQSIYGTTYTLDREVVNDAHSLLALVDGCGRSGAGGLAVSLCLRSLDGVEEAWKLALQYRERVIDAVRNAQRDDARVPVYTIEDAGLTSNVADILAYDREQATPVAVIARAGDRCHVSTRCPPGITSDLEALMREIGIEYGGSGGGHPGRAGATIDARQINQCRKRLAEALAV
jgi:single-stranded-DNA-specific exonuclease